MFKETKHLEKEKKSDDIEVIKKDYKRVIHKFNTLANRYTQVKNIVEDTMLKAEKVQQENFELRQNSQRLKNENLRLKDYIDKTFEYVSLLFDFSKDKLKNLVNSFIEKFRSKEI